MANAYQSTGDTGVSGGSVNVNSHATGNPFDGELANNAGPTAGHTWLIVVGAIALLWLYGGAFRKIRF